MPTDREQYVAEWYRIADSDLDRARRLVEDRDWEGAGFNLQQAVEKFLKGYLISHDWELRRTHNLSVDRSRHPRCAHLGGEGAGTSEGAVMRHSPITTDRPVHP